MRLFRLRQFDDHRRAVGNQGEKMSDKAAQIIANAIETVALAVFMGLVMNGCMR